MSGIDVIVPCYNYGRYLRECVDSVLSQAVDDLRVLVIDDASEDDTPAVCADLAARDRRVEILRHASNHGHIATYNEGIELARRDYMLLLSADDFLMPGALARAIAVLDARPDVGLVHGRWYMHHDGDRPPTPDDSADVEFPESGALIEFLAVANMVGTATAVVRTTVQKSLGGYYPHLHHAGDLDMWVRFAVHGQVAYIPTMQAAYRRHETNMSKKCDRLADLLQCLAAFEPNYSGIRERLPDGAMVERRVRRTNARRALRCAAWVFKHRRPLVEAVPLLDFWLRERLSAAQAKLLGRA